MARISLEKFINEQQIFVPKILFSGENYKNLSGSALRLYILLDNKTEESIENNWVDEHKRVYFIFSDEELSIIFNYSVEEVLNAKKELEDLGLLLQEKKENGETRLYLGMPEATQKDINLYKNNYINMLK